MSRKAYCKNCPDVELVTDEEQEAGYCAICIDNGDIESPEPYDCDMDIEAQKLEEMEHPDEKANEGQPMVAEDGQRYCNEDCYLNKEDI